MLNSLGLIFIAILSICLCNIDSLVNGSMSPDSNTITNVSTIAAPIPIEQTIAEDITEFIKKEASEGQ